MTPIQKGARFGAYHRVSQVGDRDPECDSYITEADAFDQIEAWARMRGVAVAERYLDRDVSGKTMDRPDLNRMLEDLRAGRLDGIAVAKVDRLSRADVGDALRVVAEINEIAPGQLAILDLGLDPASDTGEMVLGVLLVLARWQWKRYKTGWRTAQERAVARGVFLGPAPFGYRSTVVGTNGNGKPVHGPLEVDPSEGPAMTEAFRVAATEDIHAAVRHLAETFPDRAFPTKEVRRMLGSRAYLGEVVFGELVNANAHEPLATLARFEAAQAPPHRRRSAGDYSLSGIARCECGAAMIGSQQTVKGTKYKRYRCSSRVPGHSAISAERLEAVVREAIVSALSGHAIRVRQLGPSGADEAQEVLARAEDDVDRWTADDRARDLMGDARWYAGLEKRSARVEEAREAFAALASRSAREEVLPAVGELDDPAQYARALRAMVAGVTVRPGRGPVEERVTIEW